MKLFTSMIVILLLSISFSQPVVAKNQISKTSISNQASKKVIKVNLNKASAKEIAKALKGVGMTKAKAIIAYRKTHGDFKAVEELASVKGIGVATVAKNHNRILL